MAFRLELSDLPPRYRAQAEAQLARLQRLPHSLQQVSQGTALPPQLGIANDDLGGKVGPVIQKIIFL